MTPDTRTTENPCERFMANVREARENGYDRLCAHCGVGVYDDSDMHDRGCPEYVETAR